MVVQVIKDWLGLRSGDTAVLDDGYADILIHRGIVERIETPERQDTIVEDDDDDTLSSPVVPIRAVKHPREYRRGRK